MGGQSKLEQKSLYNISGKHISSKPVLLLATGDLSADMNGLGGRGASGSIMRNLPFTQVSKSLFSTSQSPSQHRRKYKNERDIVSILERLIT